MRGHLVPDWDATPERLLIWLLRVVARGRSECPALTAQLSHALKQDIQEVLAAVQLLSLCLQKGGRLLEEQPPFQDAFSASESAVLAAVAACCGGNPEPALAAVQPWAGRYAGMAVEACAHLGLVFARHGLELGPVKVALVAAE